VQLKKNVKIIEYMVLWSFSCHLFWIISSIFFYGYDIFNFYYMYSYF
jgi:hypothetical protein